MLIILRCPDTPSNFVTEMLSLQLCHTVAEHLCDEVGRGVQIAPMFGHPHIYSNLEHNHFILAEVWKKYMMWVCG